MTYIWSQHLYTILPNLLLVLLKKKKYYMMVSSSSFSFLQLYRITLYCIDHSLFVLFHTDVHFRFIHLFAIANKSIEHFAQKCVVPNGKMHWDCTYSFFHPFPSVVLKFRILFLKKIGYTSLNISSIYFLNIDQNYFLLTTIGLVGYTHTHMHRHNYLFM